MNNRWCLILMIFTLNCFAQESKVLKTISLPKLNFKKEESYILERNPFHNTFEKNYIDNLANQLRMIRLARDVIHSQSGEVFDPTELTRLAEDCLGGVNSNMGVYLFDRLKRTITRSCRNLIEGIRVETSFLWEAISETLTEHFRQAYVILDDLLNEAIHSQAKTYLLKEKDLIKLKSLVEKLFQANDQLARQLNSIHDSLDEHFKRCEDVSYQWFDRAYFAKCLFENNFPVLTRNKLLKAMDQFNKIEILLSENLKTTLVMLKPHMFANLENPEKIKFEVKKIEDSWQLIWWLQDLYDFQKPIKGQDEIAEIYQHIDRLSPLTLEISKNKMLFVQRNEQRLLVNSFEASAFQKYQSQKRAYLEQKTTPLALTPERLDSLFNATAVDLYYY